MADIVIDEQEAQKWAGEVIEKLREVNVTLDKVKELCKSSFETEDTIVKLIVNTGNKMEEVWTQTKNAFETGWKELQSSMGTYDKAGKAIEEAFRKLMSGK